MSIMRHVSARSTALMAIVILSGFISCVNEQDDSQEEQQTPKPVNLATDYHLNARVYNASTLKDVFINGTDVSTDPEIQSIHTNDLIATVTYDIKLCDGYGCRINPRKCTIHLDTIEFGSYSILITDNGNTCDLISKMVLDVPNIYYISGTVEDTTSDYNIQILNKTDYRLYIASINGQTDLVGNGYSDNKGAHTLDTTINADYTLYRCIIFGCYFYKYNCTVSIDSFPYDTYFLHINDLGKTCKISPVTNGNHADDIVGVVTDTDDTYSVVVYNSSLWTFENLSINGLYYGRLAYPASTFSPATISGSTAKLFWQHQTCYMGYCVFTDNSCSVPLAGKPFGTYIIHIINYGKTCMIK